MSVLLKVRLQFNNNESSEKNLIDKISRYSSVVIFGAGIGGKQTLDIIKEHDIVGKVKAFSDNSKDKIGKKYYGFDILPPIEVTNRYPDALYLISSTAFDLIKLQLIGYGVNEENIFYFQPAGLSSDYREFVIENMELFNKVYNCLGDDKSRIIMECLLNYRISHDIQDLQKMKMHVDDENGQYFDEALLCQYDIKGDFVDAGAYIGDTAEIFFSRYPGWSGRYWCMEPGDRAFNRLKDRLANIGKDIVFLQYAAWDKEYTLLFDDSTYGEGEGGRIGEKGEVVKCSTIDKLISSHNVGYIKMDIEGAERNALWGEYPYNPRKFADTSNLCIS